MDFKETIRKMIEEKYPEVRTLYCQRCGKPTEHKRTSDVFAVARPIVEVLECQECGNKKIVSYDLTLRI